MTHPPPKQIAISHCAGCGRVSFARHVNRLTEIAARYCRFCGAPVDVELYRHDASVIDETRGPEKKG